MMILFLIFHRVSGKEERVLIKFVCLCLFCNIDLNYARSVVNKFRMRRGSVHPLLNSNSSDHAAEAMQGVFQPSVR